MGCDDRCGEFCAHRCYELTTQGLGILASRYSLHSFVLTYNVLSYSDLADFVQC
ncbi:Uncharacterised protein [Vibrio cholerae]|nr:Uncharacterised protein [Vibrio cholerae]CSB56041.1 Uncharacterised protein [Vibrio cholerae]CSB74193.1 Uncharacterised protein [Vibrio cholerae]CSI11513.1 Uncharacterised protein [Vibrio cholerae]